ncbi:hypothetical protein MT325_M376R [Paramecium bursaria chlorella virus MT325]|uniref:Uncharacterized protein M376R n=1 Tax=Paramecium bursaria Chlorella virus MT325 TaxID=346932 RepID=A7IUA6_PBCVM|nr:hypothetical protein MT325_M376R [Paramecium bursaria chlorella virus MT325]
MNYSKDGYKVYTGRAYRDIHTLREDGTIKNHMDKKRALNANERLMKEFRNVTFKIPKGIPYNIRYVFRGDDMRTLVQLKSGMLSKTIKSYISFSRDVNIAYSFAFKKEHPIIFMLDLKTLSKKIPVVYNGLWKFNSYNPHEKEVVLPPGNIIVHKKPYEYVRPSKLHKLIPVHVVTFVPNKAATNMKSGSINPYRK